MHQQFDNLLLDHIRKKRNNEALAMLTADLAQSAPVSEDNPNYHETLLHFAAYHNNAVIARRLIELGADVNRLRECRRTPLSKAVHYQCTAAIQVLLEAGARVDLIDEYGCSALQEGLNCHFVNADTFELLATKLRTDAGTNEELVDLLIRAGCNMFHAASLRDIGVMDCMLKRGVDVNSKDPTDMTGLHAAVQLNDLNLAYWLLSNGVDAEWMDDHGSSALATSVKNGNEGMMRFLIAHLAMQEMLGKPIDKSDMYSEDDRYRTIMSEPRKYYEQCQRLLAIKVFGRWSLLDLLSASERKMRFLARKETFVPDIEKVSYEQNLSELYSYYHAMKVRRFAKPIRMVKLETGAVSVICRLFKADYNHFYVFARGVVEYLDELDLQNLIRV